MTKHVTYTEEPLQMGKRVKDFLPPPNTLVKIENTLKVKEKIDISKLTVKTQDTNKPLT
jgi:hypothetical protein